MSNVGDKLRITGKRIWYKDQWTDESAFTRMSSSKARMMLNHPFWGFMGLDLVLIEAPIEQIPTLATDGYHIFYSARFINSLRPGEVEFALAHEVYHCILGHTAGEGKVNRGPRTMADGSDNPKWDAELWNKACDYVINYDLKQSGVGEFITTIKILYDVKYADMSSEAVYEELLKNPPPPEAGQCLDTHIEFAVGEAGSEGSSGTGDGKTVTVVMTNNELDEEQSRWEGIAQRAVAHIETGSDAVGLIPAHLRRLFDEIKAPRIDWRTRVSQFVTGIRIRDYSYTKTNYRVLDYSIILPAFRRDADKLTIAVAIDTSGSISDSALSKFISELLGIMKSYTHYEIHTFCFEGSVDRSTYKLITGSQEDAEKELREYTKHIKGGGGTRFQSVWDYLREIKIVPRGLIFFTDGYPNDTSWHIEGQFCSALFVTVDNHNNWEAPFGTTVAYEDFD